MRRVWMMVVAGVLGVVPPSRAMASDGQTPPPVGSFSGEGLTLTLDRKGTEYTGVASVGGNRFDLHGVFDPAAGLHGTFTSGGATYAWTATVDGRTLKFQTGGTEYALPMPATPPQAENPLAKKPAPDNPLARKADPDGKRSLPAPQGALKFKRLSIKDPGMNDIEAVSFLVPDGWNTEGGIQWFPNSSILANLLMTITDPTTGAQIQTLPSQNFTWMDHPVVPIAPGTNYMGNIVGRPVADVPEFIRTYYAPQAMPQLQRAHQVGAEELKALEQQISKAYGGQSRVIAARVRYEYERTGKPWEEDVYVALVFTTNQGITIWTVNTAYSFRAPKGDLDKITPKMATIVSTSRLSPDWYGGYMYVQQLFMNRMNQGIKDAAAISATVTKNSEEIRKMFSDSYKKQCDSQDRISRGFSEYVRGVQTYDNPYDSRPVQLPSGYHDAWVSSSGEYILSTQAGFDPNVGATVEWKRMDQPANQP